MSPEWVLVILVSFLLAMMAYRTYRFFFVPIDPRHAPFPIGDKALVLFGPLQQVHAVHYDLIHARYPHRNQTVQQNRAHWKIWWLLWLIPIPIREEWRYERHAIEAGLMPAVLQAIEVFCQTRGYALLEFGEDPFSRAELRRTRNREAYQLLDKYREGIVHRPPPRKYLFGLVGPFVDTVVPSSPPPPARPRPSRPKKRPRK